MPTTNTTQSTNQYNQGSLNTYNAFQPQLMGSMMAMAANPLGNSYFQNQLAQNQRAAAQLTQRQMANFGQNLRTGGGILSNSGGFLSAGLNRASIAGSNMQANAFNSAMNTALQNRAMSLMSMQAYQPLQTGQSSTQSTGGLGTWLPQVAGMAMNMFAPGIGSMMAGNGFQAGYQQSAYNPASMRMPTPSMQPTFGGQLNPFYGSSQPGYQS